MKHTGRKAPGSIRNNMHKEFVLGTHHLSSYCNIYCPIAFHIDSRNHQERQWWSRGLEQELLAEGGGTFLLCENLIYALA